MSISVRPFEQADAESIARLFNAHKDSPNPVEGGITGDQLALEIRERGVESFLVAVDGEQVIGTFGVFRSNGRRSVAEHEGFADMFFVAPGYRRSVASGLLFTEAVEGLFRSGRRVLRLTVNPANSTAFRLYRRVGCMSLGYGSPGEDGNVQLYNYIPLIMRAVVGDLSDADREQLGELRSFGSISERLDDHLASDAFLHDGRLALQYHLALGGMKLNALVDAHAAVVVEATLIGPDGSVRRLELDNPPAIPEPDVPAMVARCGDLTLTVDPVDGTVDVGHPDHYGPLVSVTWPGRPGFRAAGWRESDSRAFRMERISSGVRITELETSISCTARVEDDALIQDFVAEPNSELRMFESVGLRTGWFDAVPVRGPSLTCAPVGAGLAVRDCTEVVAASVELDPSFPATWYGEQGEKVVETTGRRTSMIHSTLLDRRFTTDESGAARIVTVVHPPARSRPGALTFGGLVADPVVSTKESLRIRESAAGVADWRINGRRLVRTPFPRIRGFACNPYWRAGVWATHEPERHRREHGMGWGLSRQTWSTTQTGSLISDDRRNLFTINDSLVVGRHEFSVTSAETDGEDVLWLTPMTGPGTRVVFPGLRGPWSTPSSGVWQRWTPSTLIELDQGIWLSIAPAPGHEELVPEILVRSTPSGLLVGCTSRAGLEEDPMVWRVRATGAPLTRMTRLGTAA